MAWFGRSVPRVYDAILSKLGVKAQLTGEPRRNGDIRSRRSKFARTFGTSRPRARTQFLYRCLHARRRPAHSAHRDCGRHVGRGSGALAARNRRAPRSDVLKRRRESRCDGVTALNQSRDVEVYHEDACSRVAYPSDRIGHRGRAGVGGGRIRRRDAQGARTVRCDERRHALSLARRIVAKETEREVHSPRHGDSYGQCGLLGRAVRSAV
jgi:hypothetical protein